MLNKRIEKITMNILQEHNINTVPIQIDQLIEKRNLTIKYSDLGEGVSGVLLIRDEVGVIGINKLDSEVRKRFTKAHELAHFELHRNNKALFIDKKGFTVLFRDNNSKTGEFKIEQEANAFAAAILMPEKYIIEEVQKNNYDLFEDACIIKLAKKFEVSTTAMTYRIANLNIL
jgi:Zn-dependent peptidase ImmA (M78 family)